MSVKDKGEVSATDETVAADVTETATADTRAVDNAPVSGTGPTRIVGEALPPAAGRPELTRGTQLGRYVVLDELGRGGLGIVVRAFDPELERQVAIKLVRIELASDRTRARERLMREAQAVAQLAHPNVVAVHDVGTVGDEVFVAMELVEGKPLSQWLAGDVSEGEVLDVFEQAAAGLIAAHDTGLIHRDFKPDNVLVGADGRVRVVDFGLARALEATDVEVTDGAQRASGPSVSLTHTGAVMGTPAYMAPEQHRGESVDARADQWAFCASLHEALAGARPFHGETYAELAGNVLAGNRAPGPTEVSRRLGLVVDRGLRLTPDERYPSMRALLDDLRVARSSSRLRRGAALGGLFAVAAAIAFVVVPGSTDKTCSGGREAMTAIWNPGVKDRVRAAFAHSTASYRAAVLSRVESDLDRYTRDWAVMHREACEATRIQHSQSERALDLRTACLDRRRAELAALVGYLVEADAALVDRASRATASLSRVSDCADVTDLMLVRGPPDTPGANRVIESLGEAKAHRMAGNLDLGERVATDALEVARANEWVSLEADALFTIGIIRSFGQQNEPARAALLDAYVAAEEAVDQVLKARIAHQLAVVGIDMPGGRDDALEWLRRGRASLRSVGGRQQWDTNLDATEAAIRARGGEPERALALFDKVVATRIQLYGPDDLDVAVDLANRASALSELGREEEAAEDIRRALGIIESIVGPTHPLAAQMRLSYGHSLMRLGNLAEAETELRESVALHATAFGESNAATLHARVVLGMCLSRLGRQDDALQILEETLSLAKRSGQAESAVYGDTLAAMADAHQMKGENVLAFVKFMEARDVASVIYGPDSPVTLRAAVNMAAQQVAMGQFDSAHAQLTELVAAIDENLGTSHPLYATAQIQLARAYIGAAKHREAIVALEAALAVHQQTSSDPTERAIVQHQLAVLLWEENLDRPRAKALARSSLDIFRAIGTSVGDVNAKESEAWLREHGLLDESEGAPP